MQAGEEAMATTETPGTHPPREVPLPPGRLVLVMLPFSLLASTMTTAMDLWSAGSGNGNLSTSLLFVIFLMTLSIDAGLTGSLAKKGTRNPLTLRATGSVGLVILLPVVAAVVLTLGGFGQSAPLAVIGFTGILLPLAFALAGPWLARQIVPGGPAAGGTFLGRFWRMILIGSLPLAASLAVSVVLRGGDVPLMDGYWTGALVDTLLSTLSNLSLVVYAWAITRTARVSTAEVFA